MADQEGLLGQTWLPVDLEPYLRGQVTRPEPTVGIVRRDGLRLLYPGREHTVIGEMESGKSWFSLACSAAELHEGYPVVYVHFEESDPTDTLERLRALAVPDALILELFRFVGPSEPVDPTMLAILLDPAPSLVVLDGVNEAMALHNMGIRDEDGAAAFRRRLVKPCTARGAAVLADDHVVKDRERRDRGPLGSIHKGNGLTGALILLENVAPFGRGERGCSHVFVTKDRPGYLRRAGRPDRRMPGKTYMGSLVVDDTRTWRDCLDLAFIEPQDKDDDDSPTTVTDDQQVLAVIANLAAKDGAANMRGLYAHVGLGKDRVANAVERLVTAGAVFERSGPRRARLFTVPEPATPTDPDPAPVTVPGATVPKERNGARTVNSHRSGVPGNSQEQSGTVT